MLAEPVLKLCLLQTGKPACSCPTHDAVAEQSCRQAPPQLALEFGGRNPGRCQGIAWEGKHQILHVSSIDPQTSPCQSGISISECAHLLPAGSRSRDLIRAPIRSEQHARRANANPGENKRGRERTFHVNREDWKFLIKWKQPDGFPRWIHWPPVYYFAYRTLMLLGEHETPGTSERLRAIQQRGFLDEIAHPGLTGRQLTDAVLRDAGTLGQLMENDFALDPVES